MESVTNYNAANDFIFRPRGYGRFSGAAFLALWLCMWAAGEAFALFLLGHGLWSVLTGSPTFGSGETIRIAPALGVGTFLLVWLTMWTSGGVMAFQELLRLLWAEDRLVLGRDTLSCLRQRGPFKSTRHLNRNEIRRVFVQSANTALIVQQGANLIELTDLGTPAERSEAAQRLRAAMALPDEGMSAELAALPDDWQTANGRSGERLLVPNLKTRRKQAVVVASFTSLVWGALLLLMREATRAPNLWVVTLMLTPLAIWLARQALWMFRGRNEWRIESGRLVYQRRLNDVVTEICQAKALELAESRDSDNDPWYYLNAIELSPTPLARADKTPEKIKITHSIHDPTEPRCLGHWLSQQAAIPFHDRVPGEKDKQAEISGLVEQLASSGRFGRFVGRLLNRGKHDKGD
ncbi:MAG TPA: hypothetical protein DCG57_00555 [Candidatus Riflebacteria bacterium]|jgi:hypothetical protein|nr:hypothetical protein [Candidatus Riflebacteria bacterium]